MMIPDLAILVMAGGSGSRYASDRNKLLEQCGGVPLFVNSLKVLASLVPPGNCLLVVPETLKAEFAAAVREFLPKSSISIVTGGASRSDSVRNGLAALAENGSEFVAIHDAARPLVTAELLNGVLAGARRCGGAVPGKPVTDTLKKADASGRITATVDRTGLWRVETPQVFRRALLQDAYARFPGSLTDDAGIMEQAGYPVEIVENPAENLKLTYPGDFEKVCSLLEKRR